MSRPVAGRKLLEAVNALVKAREPDLPEFEAACQALAGYFNACTGLPAECAIKVNASMDELKALLSLPG